MVFDFIPNLLVRIHLRSPSWQKESVDHEIA
jgi:hypothetical protein